MRKQTMVGVDPVDRTGELADRTGRRSGGTAELSGEFLQARRGKRLAFKTPQDLRKQYEPFGVA